MEIILMRHGKPSLVGPSKIKSSEMPTWVEEYDLSNIGRDVPPESLKPLLLNVSRVLSSPLPRTITSLKALDYKPDRVDNVFREAELPTCDIPYLTLSASAWAVYFRIMWLCGISRNVESKKRAKLRSLQAADLLIHYAKESTGSVLLMGHGIMNRMIGRELVSLGLKEFSCKGDGYWSVRIYRL